MTFRQELGQGPIHVAYGQDQITGFFIAVSDDRLTVTSHEAEDWTRFCEKINATGSGAYLHAHTGREGFGGKVDIKTMFLLWQKYGAQEEHLGLL